MTIYDLENRLFTVASVPSLHDGYVGIYKDEEVSEPTGKFQVYRSFSFGEVDSNDGDVVLIKIKLSEGGAPLALHKAFNIALLGTETLWPALHMPNFHKQGFMVSMTGPRDVWVEGAKTWEPALLDF